MKTYPQVENMHDGGKILKACVCYFLTIVYFYPNYSSSKTMKNVFYFIWKARFVLEILKFLYFRLPLFFLLSAIALELDLKLYDVINCPNKSLITHFV